MKNYRVIWKHEVDQANKIAITLLSDQGLIPLWRFLIVPLFFLDRFRFDKKVRRTRKNILFTKELAFSAAREIKSGKERGWELRRIEIKTKEILDKDRGGFYTEKIRKKQLIEIDFLIDYFLQLLDTNQPTYPQMIMDHFKKKGRFTNFLIELQKVEEEVIQAAVTSMRTGNKKERRNWFDKLRQATKESRMKEAEKIFSKSP